MINVRVFFWLKRKVHLCNSKAMSTSFACINFTLFIANVACDLTAPFEHAPAIDLFPYGLMHVAAIATHQITSINGSRCCITFSSARSKWTRFCIEPTEIHWVFRINKIVPRRLFNWYNFWHKTVPIIPCNYLCSTVKTFLQPIANLTKWCHFHPTRTDRTCTRHT